MSWWPVESVGYEQVVAHRGSRDAHAYGGMVAVIEEIVEHDYGLPLIAVNVSTAKKVLSGSGRASKAEMVWAARQRFAGVEVVDDNAADAAAIAMAALSQIGGVVGR